MEEKTKKKHKGLKIFGILLLVIALLLLAVVPVLLDSGAVEETSVSILRARAEKKSLERTVAGGGTLETADPTEVTVPEGVRITRLLTANGETVKVGDPLAEVDRISVINAITAVQESLDSIAEDMSKLNTGTTVVTVDEENVFYANGKKTDGDKLSDYAEYLALSEQHREYEELLQELIDIFLSGTVTSPTEGLVNSVNKDVVELLSYRQGQAKLVLLGEGEDPDPTPSYTCFAGIVKSTEGATVNLLMNPLPYTVSNFAELGNVSDTTNMSTAWTFPGVYPVYQYAGETWSVSGTLQQLTPGDLVLCVFSEDMSESWIMHIGHGELPQDQMGGNGSGGFSGSMGGHTGGFGGGAAAQTEEDEELYSTKTSGICTVYPLGEMSFTISVDEAEVHDIHAGMEAEVTVDALSGQSFVGTVTSVSRFGSGDGGSAKYDAVISLPMSEGMLPGMNACALLTAESFSDVLTIPAAAVYDRPDGSSYVYTAYDEKEQVLLAPVDVETGFCDGESVEILSGITEGDTVVYEYYDKVSLSDMAAMTGGFSLGSMFGGRRGGRGRR